jgi:hypothetical protein
MTMALPASPKYATKKKREAPFCPIDRAGKEWENDREITRPGLVPADDLQPGASGGMW